MNAPPTADIAPDTRESVLLEFTHACHQTLNSRRVAFEIANRGRVLLGVQRLSVLVRRGRKYELTAVSGVDTIARHSHSARCLTRLAQACQPLPSGLRVPSGEPYPEVVQTSVDAYLDASLVSELRLVGLSQSSSESDETIIGYLVAESFDEVLPGDLDQRISTVVAPATQALFNALDHERTPLRWATHWVHDLSRSVRWLMIGVLALIFLVAVFTLAKVPKNIAAHGQTFPSIRRHVFVPTDAVVREIHVCDGEVIEVGDRLVTLHSPDLLIRQQDLRGKLDIKRQELATVRTRRSGLGESARRGDSTASVSVMRQQLDELSSQEELLSLEIEHLNEQLEIVSQRLSELDLHTEISGVVSMNLPPESLIGRPVNRGQILMDTYDPDSSWLADVMVKQAEMAALLSAADSSAIEEPLLASVGLVASPERVITATVQQIASQATQDPHSDDPVLKVRLAIPAQASWPMAKGQPDAEPPASGLAVQAEIHVGTESLAEHLFRGTYVWVRDQLRFRTGVVPLVTP